VNPDTLIALALIILFLEVLNYFSKEYLKYISFVMEHKSSFKIFKDTLIFLMEFLK